MEWYYPRVIIDLKTRVIMQQIKKYLTLFKLDCLVKVQMEYEISINYFPYLPSIWTQNSYDVYIWCEPHIYEMSLVLLLRILVSA